MKKHIKKVFIFIIIIIFISAFSSSYSSLNLDNLATVVAIAIDKSDINKLKLTFQFTNPSSVSESGTSEQSPSIVYTIDSYSISSGINIMNSYLGKELNLSHCKLIAFSEELAIEGISDEIYSLVNDAQIRPSTNIVITKCTAKYYIENSKPLSENLLAKYYEVFDNSSHYTGYTSNANIGDFFNALICKTCQPYAILGGISSENEANPTSIDSQKDANQKANESSLKGNLISENIGLAVFNNDSLVGELNSIETLSFLATRNELDGFLVSVPNPEETNGYIDIYMTPVQETSSKVQFVNGSPYIKVKYKFTGRIYSMQSNSKYLDNNVLQQISASCESYLESTFSNYLYKTSKVLKSDINNFGKSSKKNFLTTKDFENYNWLDKYEDAFFSVDVESNIRSGFLLTET